MSFAEYVKSKGGSLQKPKASATVAASSPSPATIQRPTTATAVNSPAITADTSASPHIYKPQLQTISSVVPTAACEDASQQVTNPPATASRPRAANWMLNAQGRRVPNWGAATRGLPTLDVSRIPQLCGVPPLDGAARVAGVVPTTNEPQLRRDSGVADLNVPAKKVTTEPLQGPGPVKSSGHKASPASREQRRPSAPHVPRKPARFHYKAAYLEWPLWEVKDELGFRRLPVPASNSQWSAEDVLVHDDEAFGREFEMLRSEDIDWLRETAMTEHVPMELDIIGYHPLRLAEMIASWRARRTTAQWYARVTARVVTAPVPAPKPTINPASQQTAEAVQSASSKRKRPAAVDSADLPPKKAKVVKVSAEKESAIQKLASIVQSASTKRKRPAELDQADLPINKAKKVLKEPIEHAPASPEVEKVASSEGKKPTKKASTSTIPQQRAEKPGSSTSVAQRRLAAPKTRKVETESNTLSPVSPKKRASASTAVPAGRRLTRRNAPAEDAAPSEKKKKTRDTEGCPEGYYDEAEFIVDDLPPPKKKKAYGAAARKSTGLFAF